MDPKPSGGVICSRCRRLPEKTFRCSKCKRTFYCSKECQKLDWKIHKPKCNLLATMGDKNDQSVRPDSKERDETSSSAHQSFLADRHPEHPYRRHPFKAEYLPEELRPWAGRFRVVQSPDGIESNLLLILPGLGDTADSYEQLARSMKLPQTTVLCLEGLLDLPEPMRGEGYGWFPAFEQDGTLIKPVSGERRRLDGLRRCSAALCSLLHVLYASLGWQEHEILLLGFSHGAIAAVDLALELTKEFPQKRFGGVVAISSTLLPEHRWQPAPRIRCLTPVLVTHGSKDARVPLKTAKEDADILHERFGVVHVTFKEIAGKGHRMISDATEAGYIMKFLSDHMVLRNREMEQQADVFEVVQ